jgi:hypothetical protein
MSDQSLTREEAISLYGTEAATGWGKAAADQNFKSAPSGSSSGGSGGFDYSVPTFDPNSIPVSQPTVAASNINIDDYINAIRDTLPAPPEEYLKANPFYFDEQAAREVSTAEFAPYYDELLSDYLGDIKLTSEKNRGDVNRILADLDKQKELFIQQNGQDFEKTIRGIKEGYSGKGLYFSGTNTRDQNEASAENTNKLEGYMNTYGSKFGQAKAEDTYAQTQAQIAGQQKARDIGREKTSSIYGGINTQKNEAIDEYLYGMKTYYKNPDWKSLNPDTGNTLQQQGVSY